MGVMNLRAIASGAWLGAKRLTVATAYLTELVIGRLVPSDEDILNAMPEKYRREALEHVEATKDAKQEQVRAMVNGALNDTSGRPIWQVSEDDKRLGDKFARNF